MALRFDGKVSYAVCPNELNRAARSPLGSFHGTVQFLSQSYSHTVVHSHSQTVKQSYSQLVKTVEDDRLFEALRLYRRSVPSCVGVSKSRNLEVKDHIA